MNTLKREYSFHLYAAVTILFWSLAYVLTRLTLQYFTAFPLGFLRYLAASCTLSVVAVAVKMKLPRKQDLLWFIASGACGFFFYMITFNIGMRAVSACTGSVVIATVPIMTALLARFVYQEKLNVLQWAAVAVEFAGVLVLTLMNGVFSVNSGLLWLLLAAFFLSVYNLIQRRLTKTYSALQASAFSIFFGTVMLAVFLPDSVKEAARAPALQLIYVAILGIFSSALAYAAWSKAFSKAKQASQVSNYMFLTPFLTSILGFVIAKEIPDSATLVGGAIILVGVFLFNFHEKLKYIMKSFRRN